MAGRLLDPDLNAPNGALTLKIDLSHTFRVIRRIGWGNLQRITRVGLPVGLGEYI